MSDLIREAGEKKIDLIVDKLDVTNPRDIAYAHKKYDIDILISNAGIMEGGPIAEQPLELIRSMFEVNVFGALELAQGFIKKFVAKKSGKIVFTSSMEAYGLFLMLLHIVPQNMHWKPLQKD